MAPPHNQFPPADHHRLTRPPRPRWFPTLRVLHQYPEMMPKLRCDKGAIKFVLSGANIMCPGLTSAGATMHDEVRVRTRVLAHASVHTAGLEPNEAACTVHHLFKASGAACCHPRPHAHRLRPEMPCGSRTPHAPSRAPSPPPPQTHSHPHPNSAQVGEGAPVAIYAEGKEHAMAVGYTKLSTADIRSVNKGVAVELMHHLNDGLWKQPALA